MWLHRAKSWPFWSASSDWKPGGVTQVLEGTHPAVIWEICFQYLVLWLALSIRKGWPPYSYDWFHFLCDIVLPCIFIFVLQHHRSITKSLPTLQHSAVCISSDYTECKTTFDILVNTQNTLWNLFSPSLHGKAEELWVWTCNALIVQGAIIHKYSQLIWGCALTCNLGPDPRFLSCERFH